VSAPAGPTAPPTGLGERITAQYGELSPQEQRAADFMRAHLGELAVYSASEVARMSGVSKATVSRLYRRLGFEDAEQVREHLRALRAAGAPVASRGPSLGGTGAGSGAGSGDGDADAHLAHEIANLRTALADPGLERAAVLLAWAERVLVVGFRNSYPVALHLREQLVQSRADVDLAPLPGQTVAEELTDLGADDVLVLVGFRRRPAGFDNLLASAVAGPARVVLLAEPGAPLTGADVTLGCPLESVGPFDSYAAASSLVSRLAAEVMALRHGEAAARVERIGGVAGRLGEFG
jgi:DNA-binding MurR/RpiR family transcriptional regulator